MLDKISPRKRWMALLGLLLATALVMAFQVGRTMELFGKISVLEAKTSVAMGADQQLEIHRDLLQALDQRILSMQQTHVTIQSHVQFLDYMESLCDANNLRLLSLPHETVDTLDRYQVAKIRFRLEGTYHALTQMIYQMEQTDKVASVSRCSFRLEQVREAESPHRILVADLELNRMLRMRQNELDHETH